MKIPTHLLTLGDCAQAVSAITARAHLSVPMPMVVDIRVPFYAVRAVREALEPGRLVGIKHRVMRLSVKDHALLWRVRCVDN